MKKEIAINKIKSIHAITFNWLLVELRSGVLYEVIGGIDFNFESETVSFKIHAEYVSKDGVNFEANALVRDGQKSSYINICKLKSKSNLK